MPSKFARVALLALAGAALIYFCRSYLLQQRAAEPTYTQIQGEIFHTFYQIKYDLPTDYSASVDSTFDAFSHSLNPFDSTSLITAINRSTSTETDSMIRHVWRAATEISQKSGGSYDVTCSPLINAWGFGYDKEMKLDPQVIDSLLSFVGYQRIRLEGTQMLKDDPRSSINFSSISKGYCSDLVGETLASKGAQNYMVELGGEIAFRGTNPEGKPWRIGINKPIEDSTGVVSDLQLILTLDRPAGGVATSGNYRNYKVIDGRKRVHTIDPRTGYPIQTEVLSATILAPSCMMADGLATACMTMPAREVPAFIKRFPGVEYLLILGNESGSGFRTQMSDGMRRLVSEPQS